MKITFLGTSHGIAEANRFTSSILITTKSKSYLVDAGAPIMKLTREAGVNISDIGGIFITHSHADHYMGLVEFMAQVDNFKEFEGAKITVYAPKNFPFTEMREFIFGKDAVNDIRKSKKIGGSRPKANDTEGYRVNCTYYADSDVIFDDGELKVTSIPTVHVEDSHAFVLEADGKRVLITGDLRCDLADFPKTAFEEEHDMIITEAAHPMLDSEPIISLLSKCKTKKLVITHICDWRNTPEIIESLKTKLNRNTTTVAVNDGDSFEI